MKSDDGAMRVRTKDCYICNDPKEVLYRCRYQELKEWVFLCGKCLTDVKTRFEDTYQYGGTWKSKKKWNFWESFYTSLYWNIKIGLQFKDKCCLTFFGVSSQNCGQNEKNSPKNTKMVISHIFFRIWMVCILYLRIAQRKFWFRFAYEWTGCRSVLEF